MRVSRLVRSAAVIGCTIAMAAPAAAAPTLSVTDVVRDGSTATVSGTATFTEITEPQSVGGTNTNFANPDVAEAAGVNLTDALIVPLDDGSGLRFIWQMSSMPAEVPPEGVRYTWAFRIGDTQFQLQAKSTNMGSVTTTEDPVGHTKQLAEGGDFFQLRGACVTSYEGTPAAGCYHLAFLDGSFDPEAATVTMDLPYQTRDNIGRLVAPEFKPGVTIVENVTANMSITAAFQAVIGNTTTSDYTNGWDPYHVGPRVELAAGTATANPAFLSNWTPASLSGDTFQGTVNGLTGNNTTIHVRACNGMECEYAKIAP